MKNSNKVKKRNPSKPDSINPFFYTEKVKQSQTLTLDDYITGIKNFDRKILSRAITLIESTKEADKKIAYKIVERCLPLTGNSYRIGISGIPGVGKSTFIDRFGSMLLQKGKKIAVLAIDPSSKISRGSVLGDKTRMQRLTKSPNTFIRPSPTSGLLGGVALRTRENIILCEAAGFDIIIVETVGTGQSEVAINSLVDVLLLLKIAGTGDDLQAMKKGIMEMADIILINKTDGENTSSSNLTKQQLQAALKFVPKVESNWQTIVRTCSAKKNIGIEEVWTDIQRYFCFITKNGFFNHQRKKQRQSWMHETIEKHLKNDFYDCDIVKKNIKRYEKAILEKKMTSFAAAEKLLTKYYKNINK